MKKLKTELLNFLNKKPPAEELFIDLLNVGSIYLIGGVLREYLDHNKIKELRDIDIVIKINSQNAWENILQKYCPTRNKFLGYKFICSGFLFDVWPIEETWAFKNNVLKLDDSASYLEKLQDTVFLNMDSIVYDFSKNKWYKDKYDIAMKNRVIDVVLSENPQITLNLVRMFVIKNRYNMTISDELKKIVFETLKVYDNIESFVDELEKVQKKRYGKIHIAKDIMMRELRCIISDCESF